MKWNQQIKNNFELEKNFTIEPYIDICGGYYVSEKEFKMMNDELKQFYEHRIDQKNGNYHLRGYDYYSSDPLIHLEKNRNNPNLFWNILCDKWVKYKKTIIFPRLQNDYESFINWIGIFGFLEYIFSDISSLLWFISRNKEGIVFKEKKSEVELKEFLNQSAQIVGEYFADLLFFDFKNINEIFEEKINNIINLNISDYIEIKETSIDNWTAIRSIREGDSLVLVYAAYIMKLSPYMRNKKIDNIVIFSNCFGAMNIGIIIEALLKKEFNIECKSYNILYAQNRAEEDSIYGGERFQKCYILEEDFCLHNESQVALVIDDSIFLGKSFFEIKKYLYEEAVAESCMVLFIPLTLNCDCIKYCRRGIMPNQDIEEMAKWVVKYSNQVGDTLPPFTSFWDFCRCAPENFLEANDAEVKKIFVGDDLLMKHLWARYENEIISEQ